ncbi:MAG: oligosaccharide flippase family protein [Bacteroidota bacterium]
MNTDRKKYNVAKKENATKSVLSILGTNLFLTPVQLLLGILIARYLGPELKGIQSFAGVIFSFGCSIFLLGFTASIRYYISISKYKAEEILFTVLLLIFAFSAIFCGLIYNLWYFQHFGKTGNEFSDFQIMIVLIGGSVTIANLLLMRFLVGMSCFIAKNKFTIIQTLSYISIAFLAVFLDKGLDGVLAAFVLSKIVYAILFLSFLFSKIKPQFRFNYSFIKDGIAYGIRAWLSEIIRVSNRRIDQFIIGLFIIPEMLGLYAIAVMLSEVCQKVPQSVMQVFFNKVAVGESKRQQQQLLYKIHKGVLYTTLAGAIIFVVLGYWLIIWVYGKDYEYSYTLLLAYLPGVLFYMSTRIFLQYFSSTGRPILNVYTQLSGLIVGAICYIILLPLSGVLGVAVGSSIAFSITLVVAIYIFSKDVDKLKISKLFLFSTEEKQWYNAKGKEIIYLLKQKIPF